MVNAVVLAGGKDCFALKDKASWALMQVPYFIAYQKLKIPGSYNSFINVYGEIDGVHKRRPALEYVLNSLNQSKLIDRIAVVTKKKKLEEKLDISIKNYMEKSSIVEQCGSIKENALKGYESLQKQGHTLFIAGDSPKTTVNNIDDFLNKCEAYKKDYDIIYPIVNKKSHHKYDKIFRRKYFWIIDDITGNKDEFERGGKRGFRIMSMTLANPNKVRNNKAIDFLYDIRNIAAPQNVIKAYREFKNEIFKIIKGDLKLSDIEKKLSSLLQTRFKIIEIEDAGPSFDIDDVGDSERISRINGCDKREY
ncbi:MAG: hypothetical protein V1660_03195 [archaeon]